MGPQARRSARTTFVALVALAVLAPVAASAAVFDPNRVLADENLRDRASMTSAAEVQLFLSAANTAPSTPSALKSLVTTDHAGVRKTAAAIIWEACAAWGISPRVMLTMLQKEQGLLTRTAPSDRTLARAIGAGCPNSTSNRYPGFGNQIWNGARLLDGYGEGRVPYIALWAPGTPWSVYGGTQVVPANIATFKLYVYNPSIGAVAPYGDLSTQSCSGNANFWKIWWSYFGDPLAVPRYRPVFRFVSKSTGVHYLTTSQAERLAVLKAGRYTYCGVQMTVDASATLNTKPLYRLYNRTTGTYFYSANITEVNAVIVRSGWRYRVDRILAYVSRTPAGTPVFRLHRAGTRLLVTTASRAERDRLVRAGYTYDGVVCWLAPGP